MEVKCPQCGTTREEVGKANALHSHGFYTIKTSGLHIYEYNENAADIVWACLECGCHFRGDGNRVSMLNHILGPDRPAITANFTGVKKR